jgi:hypothetical protein
MRIRVRLPILGGLFALLAAADVWQLAQTARGAHPDPPGLLVTHVLTGALAGLAACGIWGGRRWAVLVVLSWGAVTCGMLVALGPVLEVPPAERPGLWLGAAVVAGGTLAASWYLRRRLHSSAS